jgi:hypothetical protein
MTAEEILELIRAGYTKEEILAMDKKESPEKESSDEKAPEQEAKEEKKTSSPDSGEEEKKKSEESSSDIKALKDKLDALEQKFFSKNREQAFIPSNPEEDLSMKAIFTSLSTEEEKKNG